MAKRLPIAVKAGVAVLAGATTFATSLLATSAVTLGRQVVTLPSNTKDPVKLLGHEPDPATDGRTGTVTLERTVESAAAGEFTMLWRQGAGRARLLERIASTEHSVTRRYADAHGVPLTETRAVRLASAPQLGVGDLGLPWEEVEIATELGAAPAWFIPATNAEASERGDWCIHVHGRGATLTEPLRTVPLVAERGWHSLVVRYRNDPGAPRGYRGKSGLGLTEWRDVDAAMEWAVSRGARRIVLVGWSMGGAIAVQAALRSPFADRVCGLMLESPALDWHETLISQAAQMRVPEWVARTGIALLDSPLARPILGTEGPIKLAELDVVERADELRWPVLVLASMGDTVVPVGGAQRLAQTRPDIVTYIEFTRARHTRLWNTDREHWERAVGRWFDAHEDTER